MENKKTETTNNKVACILCSYRVCQMSRSVLFHELFGLNAKRDLFITLLHHQRSEVIQRWPSLIKGVTTALIIFSSMTFILTVLADLGQIFKMRRPPTQYLQLLLCWRKAWTETLNFPETTQTCYFLTLNMKKVTNPTSRTDPVIGSAALGCQPSSYERR